MTRVPLYGLLSHILWRRRDNSLLTPDGRNKLRTLVSHFPSMGRLHYIARCPDMLTVAQAAICFSLLLMKIATSLLKSSTSLHNIRFAIGMEMAMTVPLRFRCAVRAAECMRYVTHNTHSRPFFVCLTSPSFSLPLPLFGKVGSPFCTYMLTRLMSRPLVHLAGWMVMIWQHWSARPYVYGSFRQYIESGLPLPWENTL